MSVNQASDDIESTLGGILIDLEKSPIEGYTYDGLSGRYILDASKDTVRSSARLYLQPEMFKIRLDNLDIKNKITTPEFKRSVLELLNYFDIDCNETYLNNAHDLNFVESIWFTDLIRTPIMQDVWIESTEEREEPEVEILNGVLDVLTEGQKRAAFREHVIRTALYSKSSEDVLKGNLRKLILDSVKNSKNPERIAVPLVKACIDAFYFRELKNYILQNFPTELDTFSAELVMKDFLSKLVSYADIGLIRTFEREYIFDLTHAVKYRRKPTTKASDKTKEIFSMLREEVEVRERYQNAYGKYFLEGFYHYELTALAVETLKAMSDNNKLQSPAQQRVEKIIKETKLPTLEEQIKRPGASLDFLNILLGPQRDNQQDNKQDDQKVHRQPSSEDNQNTQISTEIQKVDRKTAGSIIKLISRIGPAHSPMLKLKQFHLIKKYPQEWFSVRAERLVQSGRLLLPRSINGKEASNTDIASDKKVKTHREKLTPLPDATVSSSEGERDVDPLYDADRLIQVTKNREDKAKPKGRQTVKEAVKYKKKRTTGHPPIEASTSNNIGEPSNPPTPPIPTGPKMLRKEKKQKPKPKIRASRKSKTAAA